MGLLAIRSARGFIETNALDRLISWVLRAYATIAFAFIFLPIVTLVVDLEGHSRRWPGGLRCEGQDEEPDRYPRRREPGRGGGHARRQDRLRRQPGQRHGVDD